MAAPGGRLPALVQPQARHHRGIVGPPDARHEGRLGRRRHGAGGGAEHIGHAAERPCPTRRARRPCRRRRHARRSAPPQPACRAPGRDRPPPCRQAGCRARVPPGTISVPMRRNCSSASAPRPDRAEIAVVPALLVREIGPFAGDRADRAGKAARRAPGQEIGEVHELPGSREGRGMFSFSHKSFGVSISGEIVPADIVEHRVPVALIRLACSDGAVVHPDDDVARRVAGRADRKRLAAVAQHDQRTGRVEADAGDRLGRRRRPFPPPRARWRRPRSRYRRSTARRCRRPRARAGCRPWRWREPARRVEDAGAGAARADVDAEIMSGPWLLRHVRYRSLLCGRMTRSRMVTLRGRVSMNSTASATSSAASGRRPPSPPPASPSASR